MAPRHRTGVDLGGTKIEALVLAPDGAAAARRRIATPRGDYDATVRAVRDLVLALETEAGVAGATVGVAIPGAVSPATGLIKNANSTWLIGKPFDADLAAALDRPVRLENDANCLALSEASDGAGAGRAVVFAAILGTGVGGGLALAGRPHGGRNLIAGEWGHNPLPWPADDERPGPTCYCGRHGCIETFLSGPGLARDAGQASGEDVVAAAVSGQAAAEAALRRYEDRLGRALATVINLLDPDVIVLGGGLSKLDRLYRDVPARWASHVFSDAVDTPLLPAKHGDASGVRGAAWLWPLES
ncbi:MAG: ROK family protein [Alphaproteobacteria bacterium]